MAEVVFAFGVALFVTLLVLAFRSGQSRKRNSHFWLVGATLIVMIGLIYWVEKLVHGRSYDLVAFRTHMACVSITLLTLAVLAVFGALLILRRPVRAGHRVVAWFFVGTLLPTVGTGVWLHQTIN